MANAQQTRPVNSHMSGALRRAEAGDRLGFALAVRTVGARDLGSLQDELNARARIGTVDPLDAAVALFDIFQARRTAAAV